MQNLFFIARENGMTNDPKDLYEMYLNYPDKERMGLKWAGDDKEVEQMIIVFFKPERFLKRLQLYFNLKNRKGQYKHLNLFGFYL